MRDLPDVLLWVDAALALVTIPLLRSYGVRPVLRYGSGLTLAVSLQRAALAALNRHVGSEPTSVGDVLTYGRASCSAVLAGLVASGVRDRAGRAGWLGFLTTVVGATALDWLDGPLARRARPTRRGSVLDIEADSWLTLWAAAAAVTWGDLPCWCLLPPLLRYLHPLQTLRGGALPTGGGPWWSRAAGVAQMVLFATALWPRPRPPLSAAIVALVSGGQAGTVLLTLPRRHDGG